jgi:hypothetical protein
VIGPRGIGRVVWHWYGGDSDGSTFHNSLTTTPNPSSGANITPSDGSSRPTNLTWLGGVVWDDNHGGGATSQVSLQNPGFETGDLTGWSEYDFGNGGTWGVTVGGSPHSGNANLYHYGASNDGWQCYTSQHVTLPNGTYTLSAWCGGSAGLPHCYIGAKGFGGSGEADSPPVTSTGWQQYSVTFTVTNGQADVFFYTQGNAGQYSAADDFTLAAT